MDRHSKRTLGVQAPRVQIASNRWRREYNQLRPHSSLGYRPPAPDKSMVKIL